MVLKFNMEKSQMECSDITNNIFCVQMVSSWFRNFQAVIYPLLWIMITIIVCVSVCYFLQGLSFRTSVFKVIPKTTWSSLSFIHVVLLLLSIILITAFGLYKHVGFVGVIHDLSTVDSDATAWISILVIQIVFRLPFTKIDHFFSNTYYTSMILCRSHVIGVMQA